MRLNKINIRKPMLLAGLRVLHALDRRERSQKHFSPAQVRSVLIIPSTQIGDMYMSLPAIHVLIRRYGAERITVVLNEQHRGLFAFPPGISVLFRARGWRGFGHDVRLLRKVRPDLALILHANEFQHTPLAYLSGARFIFQLPNTSRFAYLLSNNQRRIDWDEYGHAVNTRLEVARLGGGSPEPQDCKPGLFLHHDNVAAGLSLLNRLKVQQGLSGLVGFQLGASTRNRCWPEERYVELARKVIEDNPSIGIALIGGPDDRDLAENFVKVIGRNVINLIGKTELAVLPGVISGMAALVTPDTGMLHMAEAVNTPMVALFAVADSRFSGPGYLGGAALVIQKERTCDPCSFGKCPYRPAKCMEQIQLEEVWTSLAKLLPRPLK